ncbi:MAG: hypothetical protein V4650_00090 [Pseudomonadota bacterium]
MVKKTQMGWIGGMSLMALAVGSAFNAASANAGNVTEGKVAVTAPDAIDILVTAERLAAYGLKENDAVALIQAAKMKKSVPTQAMAGKPKTEKPADAKSGKTPEKKEAGVDTSADALLARATVLAGDNASLKLLIADARATGIRGAVRGPGRSVTTVDARSTDSYQVTFRGGEMAGVIVKGDGDTDLDLYVYDENGNRICADADTTDTMVCRWNPSWTGSFTIRVANLGNVYNQYTIIHN